MALEQDNLWNFFQNQSPEVFAESVGRNSFLVSKIAPGSKVLNIGVGTLVFERLALERGIEVYGLDPSEKSVETARTELGLGERVQVGYSQKIPFSDMFFDTVVMSEVLEHLDDNVLHETLAEVQRVLRPGASFIGTVPHDEDMKANVAFCPHCGESFHRWGHQQSFTCERFKDLLTTKFSKVKVSRKKFVAWKNRSFPAKIMAVAKLAALHFGVKIPDESIYFRAVKK